MSRRPSSKPPQPTPAPRTRAEIEQEYGQTCAALGDKEYLLRTVLPEQIGDLYRKLHKLRAESMALDGTPTPAAVRQ